MSDNQDGGFTMYRFIPSFLSGMPVKPGRPIVGVRSGVPVSPVIPVSPNVQFVDPSNGRPIHVPPPNLPTSRVYNDGNLAVTISGLSTDVNRAMDILRQYSNNVVNNAGNNTVNNIPINNNVTFTNQTPVKGSINLGPGLIYSGSGILIFENTGMPQNPSVLLFKSARTGQYADLGGSMNIQDTAVNALSRNAMREAVEESAGMIRFTEGLNLTHAIDNNFNDTKYRTFNIYLNQQIPNVENVYNSNRQILNSSQGGVVNAHGLFETNAVARFPYSNLLACANTVYGNNSMCQDINGVQQPVNARVLDTIRMIRDQNQLPTIMSNARSILGPQSIKIPNSANSITNFVIN